MATVGYSNRGCRTIKEGSVQVIYGKHNHKKRYIKALSGDVENCSAKLEVYEDAKSANKGKSMLREIPFTEVKYVNSTECRDTKAVTITMQNGDNVFSFYVTASPRSTEKWFRYCGLLLAIPRYVIPEIPEDDFTLQHSIEQYNSPCKFDAVSIWMVRILTEGIGGKLNLAGLNTVTICQRSSTFNVCSYDTGHRLLAWHRDDIRQSGCVESLVFLEVDERCHGGPGLIWMQHPMPQSMALQQNLHDFICESPEDKNYMAVSLACHVHVNSAMSNTYISQTSGGVESGDTPLSLLQHDASQHSLDSQCSSGYCSDTSSCGGSRSGSFRSNSNRLFHPKGTFKYFPNKANRKNMDNKCDTLTESSPVKDISLDGQSSILSTSTYENCFVPGKSTSSVNSYENALPVCLLKAPPIPPKSYKKPQVPVYENTDIISKRSSSFPASSGSMDSGCRRCMSCDCHKNISSTHLSTVQQSSVQKAEVQSCSPDLKQKSCCNIPSKHQLEKLAFKKCSVSIVDNLDISAIFPHLNAQDLLTETDRQILLNVATTNVYKVHHLLDVLPRKEDGFFEKFLLCLCQSKRGTGHDSIVKALTTAFKEVKERNPHDVTLMPSAR